MILIALVVVAFVGGSAFLLLGDDDEDGGDRNRDGQEDDDADDGGDTRAEPDREAYVDALVASGDFSDSDDITSEQRRCLAEAYLDGIGLERIAAESTPDEIASDPDWEPADGPTAAEATDIYRAWTECGDIRSMLRQAWRDEAGLDAEAADCVVRTISDDVIEALFVAEMVPADDQEMELPPEVAGDFYDAITECVDVQSMMREQWAQDSDMGPEAAACLSRTISDEVMEALFVAEMQGQDSREVLRENAEVREQFAIDLGPCSREPLRQRFAADNGEAFADCAIDAMDDDLITRLMAAGLLGEEDPELTQEMRDEIAHCAPLAEQ